MIGIIGAMDEEVANLKEIDGSSRIRWNRPGWYFAKVLWAAKML